MQDVWDFPRPPAIVACERRVRVEVAGAVVADSAAALYVLETSHPPTLYIPADDVRQTSSSRPTRAGRPASSRAARTTWTSSSARTVAARSPGPIRTPWKGYEALARHVSFYPGRVDAAWLGDEHVTAQEGDFYGGWITRDLVGPFKGGAGTLGW